MPRRCRRRSYPTPPPRILARLVELPFVPSRGRSSACSVCVLVAGLHRPRLLRRAVQRGALVVGDGGGFFVARLLLGLGRLMLDALAVDLSFTFHGEGKKQEMRQGEAREGRGCSDRIRRLRQSSPDNDLCSPSGHASGCGR